MYDVMKLEYEAPIYDYFGFGALKGSILKCRLDQAIPEKNQTWGLGIYIFEKTPGIFCFFTLPALGNSRQNKAPSLEIPQNYVTNLYYIPWKFRGRNPRSLEIPHDFFLVISGNSTSFLINPQKFHMQYLQPTPPGFF